MVQKHSKFSVTVTGLEGRGRGGRWGVSDCDYKINILVTFYIRMIHINVYKEFYQQMFAMLTIETAKDGNEIIPVMNSTRKGEIQMTLLRKCIYSLFIR